LWERDKVRPKRREQEQKERMKMHYKRASFLHFSVDRPKTSTITNKTNGKGKRKLPNRDDKRKKNSSGGKSMITGSKWYKTDIADTRGSFTLLEHKGGSQ